MVFSLEVRRARKGDCLLLHFGTSLDPGLAVIDGGSKGVYQRYLRPRLCQIRKARSLEDSQPLHIDLVMVSHVDDDHIQGLLDFSRELIGQDRYVPKFRVSSLWHNTFDDVIGDVPGMLSASVADVCGAASLKGELPEDATIDVEDVEEEVIASTVKVLASLEQGHRLRGDAKRLGWQLNAAFDGQLIQANPEEHAFGDGLTLTVAGPTRPELVRLQQKHDAWLMEQREGSSVGAAALAKYVDHSVTNVSSLVVLAKSGGKRILLTGDARGDRILAGLEMIGARRPGETMHIDIMKVPHHGSANNVSHDFYESIIADHYVFSGNGEHGNPARESMEMLLDARGGDPLAIHFNYPIEEIDVARRVDWEKKQAKERKRVDKGAKSQSREDWSSARHGLSAFFARRGLRPGQELRVVAEDSAHVIDLQDPIGI